jgi:hypothetical protein
MRLSRPWFCQRAFRALAVGAALAAGLLLTPGPTPADLLPPLPLLSSLYRVEEDWTLTINQPNSDVASPQVSTQMSRSPTASRFCNFHLNSVDVPSFALGGLQLQAWRGTSNIGVYTSPNSAIMGSDNEMVTWTQYLRNDTGQLRFGIGTIQPAVPGASSTTWGDFSGMEITVTGASTNLDTYDPAYSLQNSGVTFGANRVTSMVLTQVRYYYTDGTVITDSTPRVVYSAVLDPALSGDN